MEYPIKWRIPLSKLGKKRKSVWTAARKSLPARPATISLADLERRKLEEESTAQWSDIHVTLMQEIFRRIPTLQRTKYRRVSTEWNAVLRDGVSDLTSTLTLRVKDLSLYRYFCRRRLDANGEVIRATCRQEFLLNMITPFTKFLFIDFDGVKFPMTQTGPDYNLDWLYKLVPAHSFLLKYHPQIKSIMLCCLDIYLRELISDDHNIFKHFEFGPEIGPGRCVTLHEMTMKNEIGRRDPMAYASKCSRGVLPRTVLWGEQGISEADFYRPLYENILAVLWPYPPAQLQWFSKSCEELKRYALAKKFVSNLEEDIKLNDMTAVLSDVERETVPNSQIVVVRGRFVCRVLDTIVPFEVMAQWARDFGTVRCSSDASGTTKSKKNLPIFWRSERPPHPFELISRQPSKRTF